MEFKSGKPLGPSLIWLNNCSATLSAMTAEQATTEARAKIAWGESPSSVRDFLVSHGLSAADADSKIKEFCAERVSDIRRSGIQETVFGVALIVGAGIAFYPCYRYFDSTTFLGGIRIIAVFTFVGLYGVWKFVRGLIYLARPQSIHKSL